MNFVLRLSVLMICLATHAHVWAAWHADEQAIMGTRVHVDLWSEDTQAAKSLLNAAMAEMHRIDAAFSPYREDSELSMLNRDAPRGWVMVSDELMDLLVRSERMSDLSDGAFDITYASVGRFFDYREGKVPSEEERLAVSAIDYRFVELDRAGVRVRFTHPQTYVDLGGIAKGHAVDRVAKMLLAQGIEHASVTAGGDSRIIGDRRGKPWAIGVQNPRQSDKMTAVLPLVNTAVSTSGDYERFFERDGVRYHHILDPQTGDSAKRVMSVTILGPEATLTDALSTTVFVLGVELGLALVNRLPGIDAVIIDPEGKLRVSDALQNLNDG